MQVVELPLQSLPLRAEFTVDAQDEMLTRFLASGELPSRRYFGEVQGPFGITKCRFGFFQTFL